MATIVGGLRDRLITDNIRNLVYDSLDLLGWFESSNALIRNSLTIRTYPVDNSEEIMPNIIVIADEDVDSSPQELGSDLFEYRWSYAVDIYAESHGAGKHLCGDIRAILEGKLPSIDRIGTIIPVLDLTLATPTHLFNVEVENIASGKQREYTKPYQKYWWTIVFDVVDHYNNEDD